MQRQSVIAAVIVTGEWVNVYMVDVLGEDCPL